ncbi:MAG: hypothetical protein GX337_09090 [Christensenellaceae bacterium]|nr:hypothetical protein [Christensenellaceae bacterium]
MYNTNLKRVLSLLLVLCFFVSVPFVYSESKVKCPSDQHDWGEGWKTTTPATCAKEGTETRICTKCDEEETRPIPKLPHQWTTSENDGWQISLTNCEEGGSRTRACLNCSEKQTEPIAPRPHNYEFKGYSATNPPRCKVKGDAIYECTICHHKKTEEVELEHEWGNWIIDPEPTCKKPGSKYRLCVRPGCNGKDGPYDVAPYGGPNQAQGHSFGPWEDDPDHPPTCQQKGRKIRKCTICGRTESRETEFGKHVAKTGTTKGKGGKKLSFSWYAKPEPSLERKGRKVQICKYCNKVMKSQEYAPDNYHYDIPVYGFGPMAGSVSTALAGSMERLIPVDLATPGEKYYALVSQDNKLIGQIIVGVTEGSLSVNYRTSDPATVVKQAMFYFYPSAASMTLQDLNDPTKAYQFGQALPVGGLTSCVISPRLIVNYDSDNPGNRVFNEAGLYIDGTSNNSMVLQEMTSQLIYGFAPAPAPEAPAPEAEPAAVEAAPAAPAADSGQDVVPAAPPQQVVPVIPGN